MIDMADSKAEYPAPDCLAPAAIEAKTKFEAIRSFGECQLDKAAVPSLLEACDMLLDERGFRGSAKAGISVFDDDFGLHAQQVAFLMKFRDLVERVRDVSGVYLTGRLQ